MKRKVTCLMAMCAAVIPSFAAGDQARVTTSPSPIVSTKSFEVKIETSDFGSDVYCYTWAVSGSDEIAASGNWDGAINAKFKMTGSGGTYSLKVDDIKTFYGLTDSQLESLTKIGFIARTPSGRQSDDSFAEVVQGRRDAYSGGEGTAASPFIIKTTADLTALSTTSMDWGADTYFVMAADITAGTFAGIGSKGSPFKGHFDGKGHSIKGARISGGTIGSATGVFNAIDGATICNLGVVDAEVSGSTFTGALIGYARSGKIERCFSTGAVSGTSICVGGLIGENLGATVTDCYSTASVTNSDDFATGGLVGKNKGAIKNTYASGKVTAYNYAGGLIGANYGSVSASVAVNSSIVPTSDGVYIARFGGNNNSKNNASNAMSWKGMPVSGNNWAQHGHHADDHNANLTDQATYSGNLGWDFANVWEWRTESGHSFPVLAGMSNQKDPFSNEFYNNFSGIEAIGIDKRDISIYPNPVETVLSIEASSAIAGVNIYNMSGRCVLTAGANGDSSMSVDCGHLTKGLYMLDVELNDGTHAIEKIIKK